MNKKGFLLGEETVEIILSVIVIAFLIFLLFSLYFSHSRNKDLELAEASLNHLMSSIEREMPSVEIYNPKGWVISSWPFESWISPVQFPNKCKEKNWENCTCICSKPGGSSVGAVLTACNTQAVCLESDYTLGRGKDLEGVIEIDYSPLVLSINYEDKRITKLN